MKYENLPSGLRQFMTSEKFETTQLELINQFSAFQKSYSLQSARVTFLDNSESLHRNIMAFMQALKENQATVVISTPIFKRSGTKFSASHTTTSSAIDKMAILIIKKLISDEILKNIIQQKSKEQIVPKDQTPLKDKAQKLTAKYDEAIEDAELSDLELINDIDTEGYITFFASAPDSTFKEKEISQLIEQAKNYDKTTLLMKIQRLEKIIDDESSIGKYLRKNENPYAQDPDFYYKDIKKIVETLYIYKFVEFMKLVLAQRQNTAQHETETTPGITLSKSSY